MLDPHSGYVPEQQVLMCEALLWLQRCICEDSITMYHNGS